jgi:hypothetical protein
MHTFRELVLGAFLSHRGFKVKYDYAIDNQTPDWCLLNEQSEIICIVELTNFHIDKETNDQTERHSRNGGIAVYWQDHNKNNASVYDARPNRLYHCLREKAIRYSSLINKIKIPYVIALFPDFKVFIDFKEELCPLLNDKETGLFKDYEELSGVLSFVENAGRYSFRYAQNTNALRVMLLPDGVFPPSGT